MTKHDHPKDEEHQGNKPSHKAEADNGHNQETSHVQELQRQIDDLTVALQRERADAVNLRRRYESEMVGVKAHVKAKVVHELLPVFDNLERAIKHVPEDLAGHDYVKGVQAVVKQFEKTLSDLGVEKIATVGQPFDPAIHEAVSMEDGDGSEEVVSEELQAGYRLGEDIIRHAMVRVTTK